MNSCLNMIPHHIYQSNLVHQTSFDEAKTVLPRTKTKQYRTIFVQTNLVQGTNFDKTKMVLEPHLTKTNSALPARGLALKFITALSISTRSTCTCSMSGAHEPATQLCHSCVIKCCLPADIYPHVIHVQKFIRLLLSFLLVWYKATGNP